MISKTFGLEIQVLLIPDVFSSLHVLLHVFSILFSSTFLVIEKLVTFKYNNTQKLNDIKACALFVSNCTQGRLY